MAVGHGKLILLGEHGVVHGRPALAASLDRGVYAEAELASADRLCIEPWGVDVAPASWAEGGTDPGEMARAFAAVLALYATPRDQGVVVRARVDIPGSAGLGCSAALGVAVIGAIDAKLGVERTHEELIEASLASERVFHGNPSGVDSAMAAGTGLAVYKKGEPLEAVRPASPLQLVVGHSGELGSTKQTVASVARQHERDPDRIDQIFDGMASIVRNGRLAAEAGDWQGLGKLMDLNQALLGSLMLSTTTLEEMCEAARQAGALGAKLTGGGGGGCMIALVDDPDTGERVRQAVAAKGQDAFFVQAGA